MQVTDEMVESAQIAADAMNVMVPDKAMRAALTAALSDKAVEVKVLEWKDVDGDIVGLVAIARTSFDTYFIERDPEGYVLKLGSIGLLPHQKFEAAKAAAQADYEQRIRSALVDVPAVEPVAPSAWLIEDGTDHAWFTVIPSKAQEAGSKGCEVTPLFASPPIPREGEDSAEVKRLQQAASDFMHLFVQESGDERTLSVEDISHQELANAYEFLSAALAATRSGSAINASGGSDAAR